MSETTQPDLLTLPLDPRLLSTPYHVQTNWHVISGTHSCGKTTIINMLADIGCQTVPESSRQYIDRAIAEGRTIEDIFDSHDDAREIRNLQLHAEQALPDHERIFLDRALPDCFAYFRFMGMNPNEYLDGCFDHCYASVFILAPLPVELDGARLDDEGFADYIDEWLARDYAALGYNAIRVPVLPPKERLDFILKRLAGNG